MHKSKSRRWFSVLPIVVGSPMCLAPFIFGVFDIGMNDLLVFILASIGLPAMIVGTVTALTLGIESVSLLRTSEGKSGADRRLVVSNICIAAAAISVAGLSLISIFAIVLWF
ncbi:MAG: hypothetical protein ACYC99_11470 [Candidatus Geothermincolia bacterium]